MDVGLDEKPGSFGECCNDVRCSWRFRCCQSVYFGYDCGMRNGAMVEYHPDFEFYEKLDDHRQAIGPTHSGDDYACETGDDDDDNDGDCKCAAGGGCGDGDKEG